MNKSLYRNIKNIFILIFVALAQVCAGQQSITWQRLYPGPYDDDDLGYDICQSDEGNFYLAGGVSSTQFFPRFYVIKINPYGEKIWSKEIPGVNGTGYAFAVTPTLGGGCVVTGDGARFVKLNANGYEEVNIPSTGTMRRLYDIKRTSDNYFIGCGIYEYDNSLLIKFDSLGNVIWEKIFLASNLRRLNSVDEAIDGGYIAVGIKFDGLNQPVYLNVIKTDTGGNVKWERNNIGYGGYSLVKRENYYISSGGRGISKFDINGIRYDSFFVKTVDSNEVINDMKILSNNRYVYCTSLTNFQSLDKYGRILISDSLGEVIRSKLFNYSEFIQLTSILKINENNIIFFGATYYDTLPKSNFYAIRTDSLFEVPAVGIKLSAFYIPVDFKLFQNYPNPFNSSTIIQFEIIKDDYYKLEIFNSLGQIVTKLINGFQKSGSYKISFSSNNLPSGLYFYRLSNIGNSKVKSLIILK